MKTGIHGAALLVFAALLASPLAALTLAPGVRLWVDETDGGVAQARLQDNDAAATGRAFAATQVAGASVILTIRLTVGNDWGFGDELTATTPVLVSGGNFVLDTSGFSATNLALGQFTEFTVQFSPASVGAKTAVVSFDYLPFPVGQPTTWDTFSINFSAQGLASALPVVEVTENSLAGPHAYESQPALNGRAFGQRVAGGDPTATLELFVRNDGDIGAPDLILGTPQFQSGGSEYILDTSGFVSSLAPGASTSFTVAFAPQAVGSAPAVVTFSHNDAFRASPYMVNLSGEGLAAPYRLKVSDDSGPFFQWLFPPIGGIPYPDFIGSTVPENAPASGARDFGSVALGGGATLVISVSQGGLGNVNFFNGYVPSASINVTVQGITGDPDFTLNTSSFLSPIGNGTTVDFEVLFNPASSGVKSATITLLHDDGTVRTPFRIHVTGQGGGVNPPPPGGGAKTGNGCVAATGVPNWALLLALLAICATLGSALRLRRRIM